MRSIAIDVRLMWGSGIGTYIRNLVPRVMEAFPEIHFYLLGVPREMERLGSFRRGNATWIELTSKLYSIQEQWEIVSKVPPETELFWSPHYVFPLFWRKKLLVTVHDTLHLSMGLQVPGAHRRLYAHWMYSRLAARADAILTVSNFTRDELVARTKVDPRKITVSHNGLDPSWFEVKPLERPHPRKYLLYVGIVKPHKNLIGLLKAYELIKDRTDLDLVLVGKKDGFIVEDRKTLEKVGAFKDRVHTTGHVEEKKLEQYYAFADLLVFPSLYEGFGLPPLEAMACGVPVAASRAAAIPEICGDAVQYFDPTDPKDMAEWILKVLQDYPRRKELAAKGLERAKMFTWESCAEKTCGVIGSMLAER